MELVNGNGYKEYKAFDSKKDADDYGTRTTKSTAGAFYIVWSRKDLQPIENCLQITKSCLENTLEEVRSHFNVQQVDYSIWLSGKTNFREAIATTKPYKGNRDDTPKPTYYKDVGAYLVQHWGAIYSEGIEADDSLGIAAMEAKAAGQSYVIVSNDKDLVQIPGFHYDWISKKFRDISAKEAKFQLFAQILSGDATDNVPGLEGVGPATAAKILEGAQSPEEMVDLVVNKYRYSVDNWLSYLQEQWALVYILKGQVPSDTYQDEWKNTKEGKYFLEKYAQRAN